VQLSNPFTHLSFSQLIHKNVRPTRLV